MVRRKKKNRKGIVELEVKDFVTKKVMRTVRTKSLMLSDDN
jgi:hypothetical protein